MRRFLAGLFLLLVMLLPSLTGAEIFGDNASVRTITWQGNVGVTYRGTGIPARETICENVQTSGADNTGVTDAKSIIQTAITNCPNGQTVYIPSGTYRLDTGVSIAYGKQITIRGDGQGSTTLNCYTSGTCITIGSAPGGANGWGSWTSPYTSNYCPEVNSASNFYPLPGTPTKGSSTITLTDATGISVGDIGVLNMLTSESDNTVIPWTTATARTESALYFGHCCISSDYSKCRLAGQMVSVTGVAGNDLTIDPPAFWAYSASPAFSRIASSIVAKNIGIEDMTINNVGSSSNEQIKAQSFDNVWVKNVEMIKSGRAGVNFAHGGVHGEVRDSYFHESVSTSSNAYAVLSEYFVSAGLIENNIFDNLVSGPMFGAGASGNVAGYNYFHNMVFTEPSSTWLGSAAAQHAGHAWLNLFEGNRITKFLGDVIHASNSHGVFFRNDIRLNGVPRNRLRTSAVYNELQKTNRWYSFVGNILGYSGIGISYESNNCPNGSNALFCLAGNDSEVANTLYRHGNYDYVDSEIKWDAGNADHTIPNSKYLASIPADWWCSESPWPAIGSDLSPMISDIPSEIEYDGGACTLGVNTTPAHIIFHSVRP